MAKGAVSSPEVVVIEPAGTPLPATTTLGHPIPALHTVQVLDRAYSRTLSRSETPTCPTSRSPTSRSTSARRSEILSPEALAFLAELHGRFDARRLELLGARRERRAEIAAGGKLDFLPETREIREDSSWQAAPPRADYADRRVEIIGPTDRKLVIDALNSGAKGFMADFEDANSPTWANQVSGHVNLVDAIEGTITYDSSDGRHCELVDDPATLVVRLRGWHLPERHLDFGGTPGSGSLVDFGLFAFHGAPRLAAKGRGAYLYLPKMEHHLEARLWDEVLAFAEDSLGLDRGQFRATVLIETLPAAFQMEEILYELREHSYGMNAGRWDYIFSAIKTFRERPDAVLPDRAAVTMTVPFMRAYTELLVRTCHGRGTFAMGGLSALIPSSTDAEANERAIAAVRADKEREAGNGFDGTWVAHPDVVAVATAAFDAVLGEGPNQIERRREDVVPDADALTDLAATPGPGHRGRACAPISASASSTSPFGSAAAAPSSSTISWRTPPRWRSRAARSGSGSTTPRSSTTAPSSTAISW